MIEYSVTIQFDKSDMIYIARIPELRGCAAHGDTREQALEELYTAYELWMETAAEVGEEIPKPSLYVSVV